jgi:YD repeat-containing protein
MLPALAAPSVCTPSPLRYGYGPRRFLTTVTQAGRVMRYDYDSSGRVKQVTDPLGLGSNVLGESIWQLSIGRGFGAGGSFRQYRTDTQSIWARRWSRFPQGCLMLTPPFPG